MDDLQYSNDPIPTFEDFRNDNGMTFWWASHLKIMLGYKTDQSFNKAIDRATKALMSLNISHYENIISEDNPETNKPDLKLSRFACYMVVMNGDPKKDEVAKAQAYFAAMTRQFEVFVQNNEQIDRLVIRDDIKEGNKSLTSAAKAGGVLDYARFTNAGYLGLYNMENWKLAKKRKVESKQLFDHMGRAELAANLFRITMTEERIRSKNVKGQASLEQTHYQVGKEIRSVVKKNTGVNPENLHQEPKLPEVRKQLKKASRELKKIDKKKK